MNEADSHRFPNSGLPQIVANAEEVVRFLKESKYFNTMGITGYAFRPRMNETRSRLEVSVFRYQGESIDYWKEKNRTLSQRATLYGIAKIKVSDIRSLELDVEADDIPPAHANIIGWEKNPDQELDKAYQKLLSKKLAKLAQKILYAA